jgi:hypothetical protein
LQLIMGREAFVLVDSFVMADLAEQIAEGVEAFVIVRSVAHDRLPIESRMLGDEAHVFAFGVVFEAGIEPVAPRGMDEVEQPGEDMQGPARRRGMIR